MLNRLQENLNKRKESGILRSLKTRREGIDFYSNDYLGLAGNRELRNRLLEQVISKPELLSGSTGSRLISGNSRIVSETEEYIAEEHQSSAALLFPSGYSANLALFSALPDRRDTIIVDEQIHRSVHDACRMSHARKLKFRHNDLNHLEHLLKKQNAHCFIAAESLYSMEGDLAPLMEMAALAEKYSASLIVDEAHAFGVFGYGLIWKYRLQEKVCATVITYGKALGAHGAAVLCDNRVKSYLINFSSPFIYSTAAQDFQWAAIKTGYDFLKESPELPEKLQKNIQLFRKQDVTTPSSEKSPVQAVLISDNERLKIMQDTLSESGFSVYAVYSPTVKMGTERLRICLHTFNTEEEIINLSEIIKKNI